MKRGLACLLAVLLLLCTACSGKANLDDEAFMPLPSEKFSWSSTLDDIQKLYPDGSLTTASDTVFYSVSQGDFGQVFGTDIKEILFMFYPTLPYNGKENPTTLMMVSYTLDSSDYDGLFEQVTKKYGEKTNEEATNDMGVEYGYWRAEKGLRDLDVKHAALTLALRPTPIKVGNSYEILTGGSTESVEDATAWPGLNLEDADSCKALVEQIPDGSDGRGVGLYDHEEVSLIYAADFMLGAPLAQSLLSGK